MIHEVTASDALIIEQGHTTTVLTHSDRAGASTAFHTSLDQPLPAMFEDNNSSISSGLNPDHSNGMQLGYQYDYTVDDAVFQWDDRIDSIFFNGFGQYEPSIPVLEDNVVPAGVQG